MSVINFKRMGMLGSDVITRFQSNVEQTFRQVNDCFEVSPFVGGGRFYEVTTTNTSPFDISTTLGSSANGWVVVDTTVAVNFYRTKGSADNSGTLTLTPSASGTYKFWVF